MAAISNLSVVMDFGTSKLTALAGIKNEEGKIEIAGMAKTPSKGIKRGVIVNIEEVAASVNLLVSQIEKQIQSTILQVDVSYAGQNMKTSEYKGYRFTSEDGIVTANDVTELLNEAKNIKIEQDYRILHVIPQIFVIDEDISEMNPVGISGRKIEAFFKLILIPESQLTIIKKVFDKTKVDLGELIYSPLAVSEAVLTNDEREMGSVLLDIGAGTTKLAVYHDSVMIYSSVIPFGGNVITRDIKEGCSILYKWAEEIKVKYGEALGDFAEDQNYAVFAAQSGWEPKEISFKSLAFIIQARLEEIIDAVYAQIEKSGVSGQLGSGIVVTGGTAQLNNIISFIKFRTGLDARKAFPLIHTVNFKEEMLDPDYTGALGLLKLSLRKVSNTEKVVPEKVIEKKKKDKGIWKNVFQGIIEYVNDENEKEN